MGRAPGHVKTYAKFNKFNIFFIFGNVTNFTFFIVSIKVVCVRSITFFNIMVLKESLHNVSLHKICYLLFIKICLYCVYTYYQNVIFKYVA